MVELLTAKDDWPGAREITDLQVCTVRYLPGDGTARKAVAALGIAWPEVPGELVGRGTFLAWRSPRESIFLSSSREPIAKMLEALAPGQSATAIAIDMSEAFAVFELHGPQIDLWLCHLVDAMSVPREAGRSSRARLADVAVFLLRIESDRLWMLADRTISPYISNWLAFSHEGAFCDAAASQ